MMAPCPEESSLREAIRTTLVQLCKVGVSYQLELAIEGTVGVTVDRQQVIASASVVCNKFSVSLVKIDPIFVGL